MEGRNRYRLGHREGEGGKGKFKLSNIGAVLQFECGHTLAMEEAQGTKLSMGRGK